MDLKHKEAKLLRDALIKVSQSGCKHTKDYSTMVIKEYRNQILSYCQCLERARNLKDGYEVCLDCNRSYPLDDETINEFKSCEMCGGLGEDRSIGIPRICPKCGGSGMVKK